MAMARAVERPDAPIEGVRFVEPRPASIAKATDLGSIQVLKHSNTYLLSDPFGDIHPDSRGMGLYLDDSRLLSCSVLRIGGLRPVLLQASAGGNYRGTIQMTNPAISRNPDDKVHPEHDLATQKLGITRDRVLSGALEERVRIVNFSERDEPVVLSLELGFDAADIFEVRGYPRQGRGTLLPIAVDEPAGRIAFRYAGLDGRLYQTNLAFSEPGKLEVITDDAAAPGSVRMHWAWRLPPGSSQELDWLVWATFGETSRTPRTGELFPPIPRVSTDEGASAYHAWERGITSVVTDNEVFNLTVRRSVSDLRLLINDGPDEGERHLAAGVPWFATLFGRDSIISALQALPFRPQLALDTLTVLAARQATVMDDWRDAEPGKILHELRSGEMARAGELPHTPYFGSIDSTPLWLILLGATYDWTGDRAIVDRFWPNAVAALDWIDRFGDRDGDGFVEYERRSSRGLYNQGWKDSADAIRDRNGREVKPPIALAEVQGYVYDAKLRMAGLARVRGDDGLAERLDREAQELRTRFEAAFWIEDRAYYAMGLDADKHQADAIASNAGQCLWTGIVAQERARAVADRLLAPDMYSGWGIRTYASGQLGYNPLGYHTGSVWPHDVSLIAAGLKRYGFHDEANELVGRVFEAAQHFADFRLPELFCGFDREASAVPVPYPVACSPQAWSAGSTFLFLQTMLGFRAHADRGELELARPQLPDWLSKVTVTNLRIGDAAVDLLFHRWRGTTSAEVLRKVGDVAVTIRI
jgi:glycogen debranching enzyme